MRVRRAEVTIVGTVDQLERIRDAPSGTPLGPALAGCGLRLLAPLAPQLAELPLEAVRLVPRTLGSLPPGSPLYGPDARPSAPAEEKPVPGGLHRPETISERAAVRLAYGEEIDKVASLLRADLSVLVVTEKIVVRHLWEAMVAAAGREHEVLTPLDEDEPAPGARADPLVDLSAAMPGNTAQSQLTRLRKLLYDLKEGQVLVLPGLDLLACASDGRLLQETRDLIDMLYEAPRATVLAFVDPTLPPPEVLGERFSVRFEIKGSPKVVRDPADGTVRPLGDVIVTRNEAERFDGFDPIEFHKYTTGMNPVRIRQAMRYAMQEHEGKNKVTMVDLRDTIRAFKVQMSESFEVPRVSFGDIGGYEDVKTEIRRALRVIAELGDDSDEQLRHELVPRGFIFYGPPGTGKTLFAKAIATAMNGSVQVVSGPEVFQKYLGESERRVRELFADARRNAPAVLVFDEFDAIAGRRSGYGEDGATRAANAIVAQILTEMDGFRPDEQMMVIGTTNRLDIIDDALLRPSRFQPIRIGLPDAAARVEIIKVHARRYGIDVSGGLVELISQATKGRNGDELRSIFRDALVGKRLEGIEPGPERLGELVARMTRRHRQLRTI